MPMKLFFTDLAQRALTLVSGKTACNLFRHFALNFFIFSLYRSSNQTEVEERFQAFSNRLPVFISMVKEMSSIQGLQKVCDILSENP